MEQNNTQSNDQLKTAIQNLVLSTSALKSCLKNSLNLSNSNLDTIEVDNFKACMDLYGSLGKSI